MGKVVEFVKICGKNAYISQAWDVDKNAVKLNFLKFFLFFKVLLTKRLSSRFCVALWEIFLYRGKFKNSYVELIFFDLNIFKS